MGNIHQQCYYWNTESPSTRRMKPNHKAFILWHLLAVWYYMSSYFCAAEAQNNMELVDLSHVFDNETIYWITQPSLRLNVTFNGTRPGTDIWYQMEEVYTATHGGTHLDAPCHFWKGSWCVSDIPLERLVVPAAVVDISNYVNGHPDVHLSRDMILEWEEQHGPIPDKSVLLIYTGWSKFWPDRLKYTGTESRDMSALSFPAIQGDVGEWLVDNRNIVGIGIDTMSFDIPNGRPSNHMKLSENNIYALENVNNLDKLPPTGATAFVMPMKLRSASGAPCRLIAQVPNHSASSCGQMACALFTNLLMLISVIIMYKF